MRELTSVRCAYKSGYIAITSNINVQLYARLYQITITSILRLRIYRTHRPGQSNDTTDQVNPTSHLCLTIIQARQYHIHIRIHWTSQTRQCYDTQDDDHIRGGQIRWDYMDHSDRPNGHHRSRQMQHKRRKRVKRTGLALGVSGFG